MDFGHKLEEVKKEAEAIDILPEPQPTEKIAPKQKNSLQLLDEAAQLAERFPEPAIAVAWEAVEAQVLDSVLRLKIRPEDANLRHPLGHAHILVEKGVIDMATLDILRRMYSLRNLAVHRVRGANPITTDEAREFLALAKGIVVKLRNLSP
jgi:uncharacterized protein YutE (UPF0331/DUF86 family)